MVNTRVIVTGGAGFIGSHLSEGLARQGYHTVIIDDLSTGKAENISGLLKSGSVEFINGSITDLPLLQKVFKGAQYVFHQAAVASVPKSVESPQISHQVNATGTLNVLLAARDNGAGKVIYASSSSVYGDAPGLSNTEGMMPRPLSPYAATKLAGEYYCQVFSEVYRLPTVCLRYFNVYGARQDPDSQYAAVVPMFIKNVLEGNQPVIFGDGEQTRDFTFVKDIVEANIMAAVSDAHGLLNICRGESITINRLVELVAELAGKRVEPVHNEQRPGDIAHSLADVSRAESFGYKARYGLKDGLTETIKWFKDSRASAG